MQKEKEQTNGERFDEFMRTVEGYPELEGTMNLCHDIIDKRTGKMTEEEWQAAERAQTETKQENCCTPIGQIKRYVDCIGCDKKPKQETPEEAAKEYIIKKYQKGTYLGKLFVAGAKWQEERMYSEEEVLELLLKSKIETSNLYYEDMKEWFKTNGSKGSGNTPKCTCNVDSFLCQIHGTSDGKTITAF